MEKTIQATVQTPVQQITLVQKSGTYNYKIVIPAEVEKKIRFMCQRVWNTEWSGTLFFNYSGTFENNDLVITCVDIFIMDIGSQTYTEFDMNPDVISYMTENPELLDCQMGLIHSHDTMPAFFSGTDTATLREEGRDRNNFVSLIVNNAGSYTAAITRKVKSKQVSESVIYDFFGEGEKSSSNEYSTRVQEIEWYYLKVEKEDNEFSFPFMDERIKEIKKAKEEKEKNKPVYTQSFQQSFQNLQHSQKTSAVYNFYNTGVGPANKINGNNNNKKVIQPSLFEDIDDYPEYADFDDTTSFISKDGKEANRNILKSLLLQLITGSIILSNESKVDPVKWATSMVSLYNKRFKRPESMNFRDWADNYIDYLTLYIDDKDLEKRGFDEVDITVIYIRALITELKKLPNNDYLNYYIKVLQKNSEL